MIPLLIDESNYRVAVVEDAAGRPFPKHLSTNRLDDLLIPLSYKLIFKRVIIIFLHFIFFDGEVVRDPNSFTNFLNGTGVLNVAYVINLLYLP